MPGNLHNFILNCSRSWWKTILLIACFALTMGQLFAVTGEFPGLAINSSLGEAVVPFDMQNDLTPAQLYEQLAVWSEASFSRYTWFQIVDFIFPLAGGLMSAVLAALGLRLLSDKYYALAVSRKLFLAFLIATCFDWLENIGFIGVLIAWPQEAMAAAHFAILAKKCKLFFLNVFQPAWILLLVSGGLKWAYQKIRPANA